MRKQLLIQFPSDDIGYIVFQSHRTEDFGEHGTRTKFNTLWLESAFEPEWSAIYRTLYVRGRTKKADHQPIYFGNSSIKTILKAIKKYNKHEFES